MPGITDGVDDQHDKTDEPYEAPIAGRLLIAEEYWRPPQVGGSWRSGDLRARRPGGGRSHLRPSRRTCAVTSRRLAHLTGGLWSPLNDCVVSGTLVETREHRTCSRRNVTHLVVLTDEGLDRLDVVEPHRRQELDFILELAAHEVDVLEPRDTHRLDAGDHLTANDAVPSTGPPGRSPLSAIHDGCSSLATAIPDQLLTSANVLPRSSTPALDRPVETQVDWRRKVAAPAG